jgi:hypothetical protein
MGLCMTMGTDGERRKLNQGSMPRCVSMHAQWSINGAGSEGAVVYLYRRETHDYLETQRFDCLAVCGGYGLYSS